MKEDLLREPLRVINIGLEGFFRDLRNRETPVVQVDWSPPAGGNRRLLELLSKLGD